MGRPKWKPSPEAAERRTSRLVVQLTPKEAAYLTESAKSAGVGVSEAVRQALIEVGLLPRRWPAS